MATKAEYTLGTNAALPKAIADVRALVPSFVQDRVTADALGPVVADVVKAALDAVDAARASANPAS